MNIITWADSADSARIKIEAYLATFNWHIIGVDESAPLQENFIYDNNEFADMIERAKANPDAITPRPSNSTTTPPAPSNKRIRTKITP